MPPLGNVPGEEWEKKDVDAMEGIANQLENLQEAIILRNASRAYELIQGITHTSLKEYFARSGPKGLPALTYIELLFHRDSKHAATHLLLHAKTRGFTWSSTHSSES